MHIIWYLMFWRILKRMIMMPSNKHEAGKEVYEGDSDDEKED